jgi:hypothetical protein
MAVIPATPTFKGDRCPKRGDVTAPQVARARATAEALLRGHRVLRKGEMHIVSARHARRRGPSYPTRGSFTDATPASRPSTFFSEATRASRPFRFFFGEATRESRRQSARTAPQRQDSRFAEMFNR